MRLLKQENSGFSLTGFAGVSIPHKYAVLSHRWGADEVTLKDLENGEAKARGGYKKLQFCAEQAARDGLSYFWIDTCTIDKASTEELSATINSMFELYRNATKCYVYLSDVSIHDTDDKEIAEHKWESAFRQSKWFQRGWTLQELVAPAEVEFFSKEGEYLGNKQSLERQIHEITRIDITALRGRSMSEFGYNERLAWVEGRETTIGEDGAYCVLGMLDIYMSLAYGEGQKRATDRLKREIHSKITSRMSIDAPWTVRIERNPHFIGREPQLAQLEGMLFANDFTSRVAITGPEGAGKTQLLIELLYRTREKYRDCSMMWISATNAEKLHEGYLEVARQIDVKGWEDETLDVRKLVQEHLAKDETGKWLLVFDDANDIGLWTSTPDPKRQSNSRSHCLVELLPASKKGHIIFATRDRDVAHELAKQNIIELPEMPEEMALQVIETNTKILGDSHPFTLNNRNRLASRFWDQGRWSEAEQQFLKVMEARKKTLGDSQLSTLTSMSNVASTYRNQGRWAEAERLDVQVMETLKNMFGDSHPFTLTSMASVASTYSKQGRWIEAEQLEVQVVEGRKKALGENDPDTLTSINDLAITYSKQGKEDEAEKLNLHVLEARKNILGENHPHTLTSMASLSSALKAKGREPEAIQLMDDCAKRRRHVLGTTHPDYLSSQAALAEWRTEETKETKQAG
jgi:tetratricopeptide (TPR) repeat protein